MNKMIFYWLLAIIITLSAAVYQRTTGPTYEKKIDFTYDGNPHKIELLRSYSSTKPAPIRINVSDDKITGKMFYKRYPSNDDFTEVDLVRVGDILEAALPNQSAAGKIEYYVTLGDVATAEELMHSGPVVIRFKGDAPVTVLIPHIFFMFFGMLFANLTGLLALGKKEKYKYYGIVTLIFIAIGGMMLGPIVQKYAFGELWTGVPFGWDLTDNKTFVAFIFWILAVVGNWKKDRPYLSILAALITLIIFSIPHSAFGSELDYSTGVIGQG